MRRRAGFTLTEVLIALTIFALIAAAGTAVMGVSIDSRFAVKAASERLAEVQRMRALLKADVSQAVARPLAGGDGLVPLRTRATVGADPTLVLALTRTGAGVGLDEDGSGLIGIEYHLVEDRLERRVRPHPDAPGLGVVQVVATGVTVAEASFVSLGVDTPVFEPRIRQTMPDAVRLRLTLETYGSLDQLLLIGSGR
ncbi:MULTISPECIES: type II secretion system minor pseudopilin GspJ [unclassified Brevundimonas]|jgi:general secretion pathway protein J|uniref:type II secretion system minor pseudopilin GspJ n=1 Tax=unclassified Brevundimonas TaxID=2622653 RepID=UPI000C49D097|nr:MULTISPECIES: type II secretion system minor pseudopilin GspJ [unclassified Brevundimonas]MAL88369.1 type II secretion system protein GspJ [Brevundimonas sp.]HAJ03423.1 type II secretion system protein GspJ [Brevundimonas sp.]|tara:strand:- start:2190 stop:2780 length:591 start_codon:yes stop_codon:yes gene_type:complete